MGRNVIVLRSPSHSAGKGSRWMVPQDLPINNRSWEGSSFASGARYVPETAVGEPRSARADSFTELVARGALTSNRL